MNDTNEDFGRGLFQDKSVTLSTSRVQIMPAMPVACLSGLSEHSHPLAACEKPGYDLCRHVDRFIDTDAGPVPVIRTDLDRWDRVSTIAVLSGIGPGVFSFQGAWERGWVSLSALVTGLISGAVLTPLLLPFIPSRKFETKCFFP